jgi:group I intron endonuclease
MQNIEIWKSLDCINYPNYEISNWGRVKSLNYKRSGEERLLKPKKQKDGYLSVSLCKDSKQKSFLVHKLVALIFLENPLNLPQINHKDENKENNKVENLEFCTARHNINYGTRSERAGKNISKAKQGKHHTKETKQKMSETRKGENNPMFGKKHTKETKQKISETRKGKGTKPILQYTLDGVFIRDWDSATTASKELNIFQTSITACCKEKLKTCGGFIWRYKQ